MHFSQCHDSANGEETVANYLTERQQQLLAILKDNKNCFAHAVSGRPSLWRLIESKDRSHLFTDTDFNAMRHEMKIVQFPGIDHGDPRNPIWVHKESPLSYNDMDALPNLPGPVLQHKPPADGAPL
jgi:hypothetical protein